MSAEDAAGEELTPMTNTNTVHPNETAGGKGAMELSPEFEKYKSSNYKQQEMKAFRPSSTVGCVAGCFGMMGVAFIAVGAVVLSMSAGAAETDAVRYDSVSGRQTSATTRRMHCDLPLDIACTLPLISD